MTLGRIPLVESPGLGDGATEVHPVHSKANHMSPIHTILHPTDFSKLADQALQVARSLARDHGAGLLLVAVPPPPPPASETFLPDTEYPGMVESTRRDLQAVAETITDVPVTTRVMAGAPGAVIVELAREGHADLIVMGTHGRTGLTRLLMGSVAEYVMRHAQCPVMTIKPGAGEHLCDSGAETTRAPCDNAES
jgi:universal stress protein A